MITVRPARGADLPGLFAALEESGNELVDLRRAIVFVAEEDGVAAGFIAARLIWQVEPLYLLPAWRARQPKSAWRRATLLLAQAMDGYIRSQTGIDLRCYYAYIRDGVFQRLAERFGLRPVYRTGKWFLREF